MADWYDDKRDLKHYNLEKAKSILIRAEQIENMEDIEVIYERLEDVYDKLGNKEKSKEYDKKWKNCVNRR